jgi:glycogen debranching enzyme
VVNNPQTEFRHSTRMWTLIVSSLVIIALSTSTWRPAFASPGPNDLELSRAVRPWEFASALGQRAALFGDESGRLEAWVYPLKIFHNFQLRFISGGYVTPGAALARTVTVRPESTTILYVGDTFTARETLFAPIHEQGLVITVDVATSQPMEVQAVFERDFQLMWPAALGGNYAAWDYTLHAFSIVDDLNHYSGLVGSPDATGMVLDDDSNYAEKKESSFHLGTFAAGRGSKSIFIAGSTKGLDDATRTYRNLSSHCAELVTEAKNYYDAYLKRTVQLELPDRELQRAYDWSRISVIQGLVENPSLGTGLIAGYQTSGTALRPGFAWFFGRDSLWTSLALNSEGDFSTTRTALEFLLKYQRADGKIPHEIVQTADVVPWFKEYPYAFASADATPLFVIAADDYVTRSGDVEFAKEHWGQIWKTYQFLASTFSADGFAQNRGVGHGWVEGGPLHPADVEFYQAGLGIEAAESAAHLAQLLGKDDVAKQLTALQAAQKQKLNSAFWSADKKDFVFSITQSGQQWGPLTAMAAVPMWFGLADEDKAEESIDLLANADYETDWGMRIISSKDPNYGPSGYHYGSVWPLFTGWASVGEYLYHRPIAAFSNLRANALLALDGSPGHTTEVLSGDNYTALAGSTSDQIWSAAMVISPLLRGKFGLVVDANRNEVSFSPHIPADWNAFAIRNLAAGSQNMDLAYRRDAGGIALEATVQGGASLSFVFSPAISLRAEVLGAELNGRPIAFQILPNAEDQHVSIECKLRQGTNTVRIRLKNDFGVSAPYRAPEIGSSSRNLRIVSEAWSSSRDTLSLGVQGIAGESYEVGVSDAGQIRTVEGGELLKDPDGHAKIRIQFTDHPPAADSYSSAHITIHFVEKNSALKKQKN